MKNFKRKDTLFSLCGLNCGLCPMHIDSYCPGCGGGPGNQTCVIARCKMQHGEFEYCYQCPEYPCEKYTEIDRHDSFITHRNQLNDMERLIKIGTDEYNLELKEKIDILKYLLENYNDGRRKRFYCISVNLLELSDLKSAMNKIKADTIGKELTVKERAAAAKEVLESVAAQKNIVLKLLK